MDAQKLEQTQKVFVGDRSATDNGAVTEQVDEGYTECWLEIQPHHLNAVDTVMGGATFILADFAFAVVSNWNKPLHISTASQITYLGVARGTRLITEARKVKEGRSTYYYLVEVKNDLGNEIAHVAASGFSEGWRSRSPASCAFSPNIPNHISGVSGSNHAKVPRNHLK